MAPFNYIVSPLLQISGIMADYKPVSSFAHLNFDDALMKAIRKANYTSPSPIQAQVSGIVEKIVSACNKVLKKMLLMLKLTL